MNPPSSNGHSQNHESSQKNYTHADLAEITICSKQACPYAQRSRIVLRAKGLPFQVVEIDLHNKPDWFLAISPYGKVPLLKHGETVLYESSIINEYLNDAFPQPPMLPEDAAERAFHRIWIDFCNNRVQPGMMAVLCAPASEYLARAEALDSTFHTLEAHLQQHSATQPFFQGHRFGLVDASYAPSFERLCALSSLRNYALPQDTPRVQEWARALAEHPAVSDTATTEDLLLRNYKLFVPEEVSITIS